PRAFSVNARFTATVDLPTPPLPLATAMTRRTPGSGACAGAETGLGCAGAPRGRPLWTATCLTPGTADRVAVIVPVRWRRTSSVALEGRRWTITLSSLVRISPTSPSDTISRLDPG